MKKLACVVLIAATGCALFKPPPAPSAPGWPALEASNFGAMENVSMCERLWFGGGVTEGDIDLAFRRGVKHVLDLSFKADELAFDLKLICDSHEIELIDARLGDAESLSAEDADLALQTFRDLDRRPLLVLCEAGSNSATFFSLGRALDLELPLERTLDPSLLEGILPCVLG